MNLTQLKYFVNVASLGSITKASEQSFVSQSAVSKTIKQLEDELGVQLFDRTGRTVVLNSNGRLFYSYVTDALDLLDRGVSSIKSRNDLELQTLNVLFTVGSPLIPKVVTSIQQVLPHLSLNIHQRNSFAKDLKQFDFIITTRNIPEFWSIPLLEEEILVGWKNDLFISKTYLDVDELKSFDLIGLNKDTELEQTIDEYLDQNHVNLNFRYQSDEPATVRALISAGLGVGFIPQITWNNLASSIELTTCSLVPNLHRTIYLATPHKVLNDGQRQFSNEIAKIFIEQKNLAN